MTTEKPGTGGRKKAIVEDNVIHVNFGARRAKPERGSVKGTGDGEHKLATTTSIAKNRRKQVVFHLGPDDDVEDETIDEKKPLRKSPGVDTLSEHIRQADEAEHAQEEAEGEESDPEPAGSTGAETGGSDTGSDTERDVDLSEFGESDKPGSFFIEAVRLNTDPGRFRRGKTYAGEGHVLNLAFKDGVISADVAGSQPMPFHTSFVLGYRSADDLVSVEKYLGEHPHAFNDIRQGRLPWALQQVLFADAPGTVRVRCSCPDPHPCCKHGVALAFAVSDALDKDLRLAFRLRGIELDEVEQRVVARTKQLAQDKAALSQENFWDGPGLPDLPNPKTAPVIDDSEMPLLHKAMRLISYTSIDELRAVSDIEDMYEFLTREP